MPLGIFLDNGTNSYDFQKPRGDPLVYWALTCTPQNSGINAQPINGANRYIYPKTKGGPFGNSGLKNQQKQ